jgi:hypothetical protein
MRSYYIVLALFFALSLSTSAQKSVPKKVVKADKSTIIQGICGTVVVKRGNYMPSPDSPRPNPGGVPAEREVLIFPLLNMGQVDMGDNGFINSVRDAKPIKTTRSDKDGKFCVSLPVGRYSVMVRETTGLYANLSDSQGNIFPVTVPKNRQLTVGITISHQAVF